MSRNVSRPQDAKEHDDRAKMSSRLIGQEAGQSRSQIWVFAVSIVIVAVAVLAAHWPALSAQALSFDDDRYLTENALVKNPSWNSARRFLCEVLEPSTIGGYYQPLAMISLMLDYAAGGRVDNLKVFHQTSLLLHLCNTVLIMFLVFRLFGRVWPAAAVALLFGLHPMTVETIAWVGERKTVLAAFFSLLSLNFYVGYSCKGGWKLYCLTLLMYVLALMSKPTSTPLPFLMLVLDYWPLRRLGKTAVLEKLPMLLIGGISGVITFISQMRTASVLLPGEYSLTAVPLIVGYSLTFYISKIFYPVHLSSHYPFPEPFALSDPMVLASVISAVILIAAAAVSLRWTRVFFAGLLFFFIAILPTMQVIAFSNVVASDKFAYLPVVGFLVSGAYLMIRLWDLTAATRFMRLFRLGIVALLIFAAESEASLTRRYLVHWQNTESLYSYMIENAPKAPVLHNNFGVFYYKNGKVNKAAEEWSIAAALDPDYPDALNNLAWVLATNKDAQKRDGRKAIILAQKACRLTDYKDAAKLDTLAAAYAEVGEFDKAVAAIQEGIQIAQSSERKELANEMVERLKLYREGKTFHQRQ
jgi:hypothetical protein